MTSPPVPPDAALLQRNLESVRERMNAALRRAGRPAGSVRLVAVTKSVDLPVIRELLTLGACELGENRPQQLIDRAVSLTTLNSQLPNPPRWHLIGQLQRNKVRAVLPHVGLIHSVDSLRLLERIGQVAEELALLPRVLLQVNISGEASKSGFSPDDLRSLWEQLLAVKSVTVRGLMTMAPDTEDEGFIRKTFCGLRDLRDELERGSSASLLELSMGMSQDFEIAIEEGATLVRLGSVLFTGTGS